MRRQLIGRLPLLVWLALVWVLLWGSLKPMVVLSALVVSPLCLAACRLPVVPMTRRPRLTAVPGAALRFVRDLLTSSAEVAWTTVRRGPRTKSAVVAVPVGPASDTALTSVSHRLSLEPGTLVLDIDRERNVLYLYVLDVDVDGTETVSRARRSAKRHAADVLRAEGFPSGDTGQTAEEER